MKDPLGEKIEQDYEDELNRVDEDPFAGRIKFLDY